MWMWTWFKNRRAVQAQLAEANNARQSPKANTIGTQFTAMTDDRIKPLHDLMLEEQGYVRLSTESAAELFKIKLFDRIKASDPVIGVYCKTFLTTEVLPAISQTEREDEKETGLLASYLFFALVELPFDPTMLDFPADERLQYCGEISLLQTGELHGEDDPYRQVMMPDSLSATCKALGSKTLIQEIGLELDNSRPSDHAFFYP